MAKRRVPFEPLPPRGEFLRRVRQGLVLGGSLIGGSLALGVLGYHAFAGLSWIDSLLNASMILTGMGPVDRLVTPQAKLFASAYALFSGVAFLTSVGVLAAPVVHRFLHRFHLDILADDDDEPSSGKGPPRGPTGV